MLEDAGQDADLEVVEAEGFGGVGVEPVAHHHSPAHQGQQQNHAHPDPRPVGHGHLPDQTQSAAGGQDTGGGGQHPPVEEGAGLPEGPEGRG